MYKVHTCHKHQLNVNHILFQHFVFKNGKGIQECVLLPKYPDCQIHDDSSRSSISQYLAYLVPLFGIHTYVHSEYVKYGL